MDSKSAKYWSENPIFYKQSKHIETMYHWVRQHVNGRFPTAGRIHISKKDMVAADVFTNHHEGTITGEKRSVSYEVEENQKKRSK
mmetsp:Transcript_13995/g.20936  ORF Transcript_13995/g.20936 Transcript_13995/m.20936 type:complete len:85 (+) Transcript_13995:839-1093(+)